MAREIIGDKDLNQVVGGSIVFNADHTTCGHNCNNQYKVLDYAAVQSYIAANCTKMTERKMISNMVAAGLLTSIEQD